MREAIQRFREPHEEYKTGAFKSPEALSFYESEHDEFVRTVLQAQQIGMASATTHRRRHSRLRGDVRQPVCPGIRCDFQLGILSGPVRGRARLVSAVRDAAAKYRTSFAIETISEEDRKRLDIAVVDAALVTMSQR